MGGPWWNISGVDKTVVFDRLADRRGLRILVGVGLAVAAAACAGGDDETSGTSNASVLEDASDTTDEVPDEVGTAPDREDSPAGGADAGPVVIGFHNMEGGAMSFTQVSGAAEAAVADINDRGGVNDRQLELMICGTDGSPESSIDCANKFVEADVAAAVSGLDIGADAMLPILADAGIPEVGYLPFGEQQRFDDNSAFFGSPTPANAIAVMTTLRDLGARKVVMFSTETPTVRAFYEDVVESTAEDFGLEVDTIFYPAVGTDWTLIVNSGISGGVDAVATIGAPEQDCVGIVSALDAAGFDGPIFMAACSAFVPVLQDTAAGVYTYSDFWWPSARDLADPATQEDIDRYLAAMERAGHGPFSNDGLAIRAYAAVENLASALATIEGPVDGAAVSHALRTSGHHDGFMGQSFNCDRSAWPGETACSVGVVIWQVNDQLELDMISDGYLDLSEYRPAA